MPRTKLAEYKAKRDFAVTAEPSDKAAALGVRPSQRLRFVIQKHAARRLHFDLRLEFDGVFKSWAVTRGPSVDPKDKRLAVQVEDHPLAYGDFEGTIPQGQYGGGTVQLWDRGYWQPDVATPIATSLRKGELKFTLHGERLRGSWVLVRMQRRERDRDNWLLISHGAATQSKVAPAHLTTKLMAMDKSVASGRSMAQIAAEKGPAPTPFMTATAESTANESEATKDHEPERARMDSKSLPRVKRLPKFIPPQLCKISAEPSEGEDWLHELKLDGYRLQLRKAGRSATLLTRNGLDWSAKFSAVQRLAATLPECIIDGELVALDHEHKPSFAALQAALSEGRTDALVYFAFDLLIADSRDWRRAPLLERKQRLQQLLARLPADSNLRYVDHVVGNGRELWRSACEDKLEGIISKRCDAPYTSNRSGAWMKTKCRTGHEVVIGGWTHEGAQLRSLLVGVMRGKHLVYVGRVGTGFSARTAAQVLPKLRAASSNDNPFHGATAPKQMANVKWLKPTLVAEIEFAGWTAKGMVRQAAFKGLREDKPARSVRAELPSPLAEHDDAVIEDAPKLAGKANKRSKGAANDNDKPHPSASTPAAKPQRNNPSLSAAQQAVLTHPDKALWPAVGKQPATTKQDLAEYLLAASEWMLEHIKGRPCSLVRAPDGVDGQHFFQRHAMAGPSNALRTIKVSGDRAPYLLINDAAALLAVAQLAGIELHPWNCVPDQVEVPGRLVFDLDPGPGVEFDAVITAAIEVRDRLQQVGLTSFCKTTGGKGLHVVVPLRAPTRRASSVNWSTAKLFAQTLCAQMAGDQPRRYLINMSKAARKGKIFLDYLRNDKTATAIAPLSPRARAGATVSMPLDWQAVRSGLDPARYTVHSALQFLKQQQPWTQYRDAAGSLADAAQQLLQRQGSAA